MTTSDEIVKLIAKVLRSGPIKALQSDKPLRQQGLDSLDVSVLLFRIEEDYAISIPTSEVGSLNSIREIVDYLNAKNAQAVR